MRWLVLTLLPLSILISITNVVLRIVNAGDQGSRVALQTATALVWTIFGIAALLAAAGYQVMAAERSVRAANPDALIFTCICSPLVSARLEELGEIARLPSDMRRWRGNLTFAIERGRAHVYAGRFSVRQRFTLDMAACTGIGSGRSTTTSFRQPPSLLMNFAPAGKQVQLPLPLVKVRLGLARSANTAQVQLLARAITRLEPHTTR